MSTIPLSMREGHGQTLSGGDVLIRPVDDDGALDALIEHATQTITERDAVGGLADETLIEEADEKGEGREDTWRDLKAELDEAETTVGRGRVSDLDRALKVAVDQRADQEVESADFLQSREWRDALDQRYGGRVAIGDLLESFALWHEQFKRDPRTAADTIAAAYLEQAQYALPESERLGPRRPAAGAMSENPNRTLGGVIDAAIERHHGKGDGEQAAFVASAQHRAALKAMFPGLTYAEACRRVVKLDGDLHRDPIGTAARLAAAYGMSVMPSQQAPAEQSEAPAGNAQDMIAATAEHLPDLAEMEDDVVAVLQRPEFMHGPDLQQNLVRAYRVAQIARKE